ncbi:hypothetical protein QF031_002320 [Pseudarthrobacter defluvii]|uniref:hypothetical protein n=1 Tax=Pseudarthrobacter defluvii TaxID=410837 RepID=UPI002784EAAB|nr:hypothetical protein [Pseudarthrobacter defluvii]MDQ0769571.1 hypothetical protein [Pseudarthrobacter defluvii]
MTSTQIEDRKDISERSTHARPSGIIDFWRSAFVRWFLLVAAMFFATAWFASLVPYKPEWGDIATWIGAIATGSGLIFTGSQIRHQIQQRHEQIEKRQEDDKLLREKDARAIGVRSTWVSSNSSQPYVLGQTTHTVKVTIQNKSANPITRLSIAVWDLREGSDWRDLAPEGFEQELAGATANGLITAQNDVCVDRYVGTFMADDKETFYLSISHPLAGPSGSVGANPLVLVSFTDTWGQAWVNSDVDGWRM